MSQNPTTAHLFMYCTGPADRPASQSFPIFSPSPLFLAELAWLATQAADSVKLPGGGGERALLAII